MPYYAKCDAVLDLNESDDQDESLMDKDNPLVQTKQWSLDQMVLMSVTTLDPEV